jgi:hypothetical protein
LSLFRSAAEMPVGTVDMGTSAFTTTLVQWSWIRADEPVEAQRPLAAA